MDNYPSHFRPSSTDTSTWALYFPPDPTPHAQHLTSLDLFSKSLPSGGFSRYRVTGYTTTSTSATPQQEELRKEIRDLKGLVLNRYNSSIIVCCIRPVDSFDAVCVLSPSQRFHPSRTHANNDVRYVHTVNRRNIFQTRTT